MISPRLNDAEHFQAQKQVMFISRINRMAPQTTENLDRFLEVYRRSGRYILTPAAFRAGAAVADLMVSYGIGKYDLEVRDAWQIGMNDPDVAALEPSELPVIPAPVVDAPVLRALEWLRSIRRRFG